MFTGIIEEVGKVIALNNDELTIECSTVVEDSKIGDSISTNGICLTITHMTSSQFTVDLSPETLNRTNASTLAIGSVINLERAMSINSRFGGHYVQGHVDTTGQIEAIKPEADSYFITISFPPEYAKYIVEKGYVAINGISLTITNCEESTLTICVIPYTFTHTNLEYLHLKDQVNIEVDILAKYVMNAT